MIIAHAKQCPVVVYDDLRNRNVERACDYCAVRAYAGADVRHTSTGHVARDQLARGDDDAARSRRHGLRRTGVYADCPAGHASSYPAVRARAIGCSPTLPRPPRPRSGRRFPRHMRARRRRLPPATAARSPSPPSARPPAVASPLRCTVVYLLTAL